jgi:hypothetical protein
MTWQMISSTTFSIAPEEARPAAILSSAPEEAQPAVILGTAPKEARPAAILSTTKRRCLHVFTLDFYGRDLVYGCYVVYIWM